MWEKSRSGLLNSSPILGNVGYFKANWLPWFLWKGGQSSHTDHHIMTDLSARLFLAFLWDGENCTSSMSWQNCCQYMLVVQFHCPSLGGKFTKHHRLMFGGNVPGQLLREGFGNSSGWRPWGLDVILRRCCIPHPPENWGRWLMTDEQIFHIGWGITTNIVI